MPFSVTTDEAMFVAVLEYDGSMDPCVMVATNQKELLREAIRQVQYTNKDGVVGLAVDSDWLPDNPFPDMDDEFAMSAWLEELTSSDEHCDDFTLTIYGPPTAPGGNGVIAGVMDPGMQSWVHAD